MIEGHTFQTAHFTNIERSSVTSLWVDGEGIVRPFNMSSEESDPNFQELLKYITIDELHENTVNVIRSIQNAYEEDIMAIAKENGDINEIASNIESLQDAMLDYFDKSHDGESLFKLKLKIFERQKIKESEDRTLKANLRKAKTLYEIMEAYSKF